MVLVDVTTTSLFYDRNCPKDIVLPMEGHVLVARNKPNTALHCVDTPSVSSWWQHCIIFVTRETEVAMVLPKSGVGGSEL